MYENIVEVQEHFITRDSSSWIIGELVAEGWRILNIVEVGATSDDWKYVREGKLCVLGRPSKILRRKDFGHICRPIIRSGRVSKKCNTSTICSVSTCGNRANFEVIFYDYYVGLNQVQFDTDYKCPYICTEHMLENEACARGLREPRSNISYPFSKNNGGQGYTKYLPADFTQLV